MQVLIIGGYGTFGYGIAELLSSEAQLSIIIAGRTLDKAQAACAKLSEAAQISALKLDRNGDLSAQIPSPPDIIIDASGPFQNYEGGQQFNVIKYALEHGCHYLDIADDLEFVGHIHRFDKTAKAKGLTLLSGLSTYPVLTAAAAKALSKDMEAVTDIQAGIAPSPKSVMGANVIAAISSYAGKPRVSVLRGGQETKVHGLTQTRRETICVPGKMPLPNILFSVVEGPDPQELPKHIKDVQNIWLSAGPRPEFLHRALIGLAWIVRLKLLPNIAWLSGVFHKAQKLFKMGSHRGGMIVKASNANQTRSWHMIAEGDDGPKIPTMPSVIMIRKWLRGEAVPAGARTAITDITLDDFEAVFSQFNISHGIHSHDTDVNLYEQILGPAYADMSKSLQDLHRIGDGKSFEGRCKVTGATNPVTKLLAAIFRLPKSHPDIAVRVKLTKDGDKEIWERFFGKTHMISTQEAGKGKTQRLVVERFGPVSIHLAILVENGRQVLKTHSWAFFGLPLPKCLAPGGEVYEHDADGRFNFHVDLQVPIFGRMVKYEGWLEPSPQNGNAL